MLAPMFSVCAMSPNTSNTLADDNNYTTVVAPPETLLLPRKNLYLPSAGGQASGIQEST